MRDVQTERYVTATVLAGDGSRAGRLDEVRTAVDRGVAALDAALDATDPAEAGSATVAALAAAQDAHATLPALRAAVDAGSLSPARAADAYDDVVAADVTVPERVAAAQQDVEVAAALRAYSGVERTIDLVLAERDLVASAVVSGTVDADTATRARGLAMQQDLVREQARIAAGPTGVTVPTEPAYTSAWPAPPPSARTAARSPGSTSTSGAPRPRPRSPPSPPRSRPSPPPPRSGPRGSPPTPAPRPGRSSSSRRCWCSCRSSSPCPSRA